MDDNLAKLAALNNAIWCDAVCRAHGCAPVFSAAAWFNPAPGPPYYPNIVTLDETTTRPGIEAMLAILLEDPRVGEFAIKDSFSRLDFESSGFDRLFVGSWLWKPPAKPSRRTSRLRWSTVESPEELGAWETGWWQSMGQAKPARPLYPETLLAQPDIGFLRGRTKSEAAAGCALTRSRGVIGVSCCFSLATGRDDTLPELLDAIHAMYPDLPLVTYQSGPELLRARVAGFEETGSLQVWLRRRPQPQP